jgi:hypothetical protein
VAALGLVLLGACATGGKPTMAPEKLAALRRDVENRFRDNVSSFASATADEQAVLALLDELKQSYRLRDGGRLEGVLAADFEYVFRQSAAEVTVTDRGQYLEFCGAAKGPDAGERRLSYAVQRLVSSGDRITVLAFATYRSKYFNPRFYESLLFVKNAGRWGLRRQVLLPHPPQNALLCGVQVFVTERPAALQQASPEVPLQAMPFHDSDAVVEAYRSGEVAGTVAGDGTNRSIIFVFTEPPPPGTRLSVHHKFWWPRGTAQAPFRFEYPIDRYIPHLIIENTSWARGSGGTITYQIFMDGQLLGEKTLRLM